MHGDAPVLLISGSFDPITPPSYAALVAASLPNATNVVFEPASHSTGFSDPCSLEMIPAFFDHRALTASEAACPVDLPPITYK